MGLRGIFMLLFVGNSILLGVAALGLSAIFLMELSRFERLRRRQANPRSDFSERLVRGLAHKAIRDITDVHNSYRTFFGVAALRASHLEEIADCLRGAMHRTATAPQGPSEGRLNGEAQVLTDLLAVNQRALEVERRCVPFSGTPEPERKLLEDILECAAGDPSRVGEKLDALARTIRFRQDAIERLSREGRRSLRLAEWGWLGTVGFSILSILLGFLSLGG